MFCPECRCEFQPQVKRCENCQVDLVESLREDQLSSPESMEKMLADQELQAVMVGSHTALTQAQQRLVHYRIPSVIAAEFPEETAAGVFARYFLMVQKERIDDVKASLAHEWAKTLEREGLEWVNVEEQKPEICPACGAKLTTEVEECAECGLVLGAA